MNSLSQFFDQNGGNGADMSAIGSFVLDHSKGFTRAGVVRINTSTRIYIAEILGAQIKERTSILGVGKAFGAQKKFLYLVEEAIKSEGNEPDSPESPKTFQQNLTYARSKVDFVIGFGLEMLPSDMDTHIGTINGYNNFIKTADPEELGFTPVLGYNTEINDEIPVLQDNFDVFEQDESTPNPDESTPDLDESTPEPDESTPDLNKSTPNKVSVFLEPKPTFTHDENKLMLTLGGILLGFIAI